MAQQSCTVGQHGFTNLSQPLPFTLMLAVIIHALCVRVCV